MSTSTRKALENKNAILIFAFQTPPHFTHFGWTFAVEFFSSVYHPQDVRDQKVSSARNGIEMELTESRRISDGFFVRVLWGWHSVGIPSKFHHDSIDSMDFQGDQKKSGSPRSQTDGSPPPVKNDSSLKMVQVISGQWSGQLDLFDTSLYRPRKRYPF